MVLPKDSAYRCCRDMGTNTEKGSFEKKCDSKMLRLMAGVRWEDK